MWRIESARLINIHMMWRVQSARLINIHRLVTARSLLTLMDSCCFLTWCASTVVTSRSARAGSTSSSQLTRLSWVSWKDLARGKACSRPLSRSEAREDTLSALFFSCSIFSWTALTSSLLESLSSFFPEVTASLARTFWLLTSSLNDWLIETRRDQQQSYVKQYSAILQFSLRHTEITTVLLISMTLIFNSTTIIINSTAVILMSTMMILTSRTVILISTTVILVSIQ